MAGGSDKRQRAKQALVRFTDEEFAFLAARADRAGLTHAAYIRATVLGTPGPRAQRRAPADQEALRAALGQLGRVGNNLNQIARVLNAGEDHDPAELRYSLAAYLEVRDAILTALGKKPLDDQDDP